MDMKKKHICYSTVFFYFKVCSGINCQISVAVCSIIPILTHSCKRTNIVLLLPIKEF